MGSVLILMGLYEASMQYSHVHVVRVHLRGAINALEESEAIEVVDDNVPLEFDQSLLIQLNCMQTCNHHLIVCTEIESFNYMDGEFTDRISDTSLF